jgi:hypothetical protein
MVTLEHFQLSEGCAFFRPVGELSLDEVVNLVAHAITLACDQGASKLLVDITQVPGLESLTMLERFFMAERFASVPTKPIKAAMVARPGVINPRHYGVRLARNSGLWCNIFTSEPEAMEWLFNPDVE